MAQSLVQTYVHIVFSTKNREYSISPAFENELYKYITGICKTLKTDVLAINGHYNHIHILCNTSKNVTLSELIKKIKANSSKWIKSSYPNTEKFYWQRGYGAFSVCREKVDVVKKYIQNQKKHHKLTGFQEEFIEILKRKNVPYDRRYIWT